MKYGTICLPRNGERILWSYRRTGYTAGENVDPAPT